MLRHRLNRHQVQTSLGLIGPMGEMIEAMRDVILAHHPAGVGADDCPVCVAFEDVLAPIVRRWDDARAQVEEHWNV